MQVVIIQIKFENDSTIPTFNTVPRTVLRLCHHRTHPSFRIFPTTDFGTSIGLCNGICGMIQTRQGIVVLQSLLWHPHGGIDVREDVFQGLGLIGVGIFEFLPTLQCNNRKTTMNIFTSRIQIDRRCCGGSSRYIATSTTGSSCRSIDFRIEWLLDFWKWIISFFPIRIVLTGDGIATSTTVTNDDAAQIGITIGSQGKVVFFEQTNVTHQTTHQPWIAFQIQFFQIVQHVDFTWNVTGQIILEQPYNFQGLGVPNRRRDGSGEVGETRREFCKIRECSNCLGNRSTTGVGLINPEFHQVGRRSQKVQRTSLQSNGTIQI
mmetsp:Transcript_26868/g.39317  ORF Transcript_26868/g.39317 Transcript_26868/m.39317 type:complete len:320 (+) Transcript_26868:1085-2044(+)